MSGFATRRVLAGLGAVVAAGAGALALTTPAAADPGSGHALQATITKPAAVAPGGSGSFHYSVQNVSGQATDGVLMNVAIPRYVTIPDIQQDKACKQTEDQGAQTLWSCAITDQSGKLAPGQRADNDAKFSVAANAPGPQSIGTVVALVVPLDASGKPTEDWHDLKGPNTVSTPITTTANHYDYVVSATRASGAVGDTVTVTAKGDNTGPSDMIGGSITIDAPSGTTLAELPKGCEWATKGAKATCHSDDAVVGAGKGATLALKFTIDKADVGHDGGITVTTKTPGDTNAKNNTAAFDITATGGQGGGDGSTLPVTGTSTGAIAGGGAAVLLAGAALFFLGRRRYLARHRG